jgi:hypothetical protein
MDEGVDCVTRERASHETQELMLFPITPTRL